MKHEKWTLKKTLVKGEGGVIKGRGEMDHTKRADN